ncbi:MAG: hypothetical protein JXQ23_07520 [Clostridia bacterium]|nr:hypothetical protein [Clostridia bacterium]
MNGREIFLRTFDFEYTDRPLKWETPGIWSATRKRWITEGYDENIRGRAFFEYFHMEAPVFLPFKGGWTGNPYYPMFEKNTIFDDGINVTHLDKDGIIKKERKKDPDTSMPQFLKFPVENRKQYEKDIRHRMDYRSDGRFPDDFKQLIMEYETRTVPLGMYIIGPFGYLRNLLGDENLMYTLFDDQEFIHMIMNDWMEFYLGFIEKVCQSVIPDFVMVWEDICYNMGPLISPLQFETFMSPYLTIVINKIRQMNIKGIIVDTDGNCASMLPVYVRCGANGFYPFEVQAGMDIVEIRKQYKENFVIIGGIDKKALAKDEQAIMNEVDKKVPFMLHSKGYIPMLDHTVPPDVPFKNFVFFIEYIRKYY